MDRLSLLDIFSKFFSYIGKNPLFIVIFIIFILVYFYFILSPIFTKRHKIIYSIFLGIGLIALLVIYGNAFWDFFDYLIDNIFVAIYFPNLPIYVLMVVLTIIIFIITMSSSKTSPLVKRINTGVSLFIIYMLILTSNVVVTKSINVYSSISVYANDDLPALVQITMNTFAIWMIVLLVIRIINKVSNKIDKVEPKEKENNLPIKEIAIPTNVTLKKQEKVRDEELFTLEEYKLLYEYLQEIKSKEQNK